MGAEACIQLDCYNDVMVVDESSLGEPGACQQKFYARGVGNIRVEWSSLDESKETLELVAFNHLGPEALAEIRAAALQQERRAYRRSPDVYGKTSPAR